VATVRPTAPAASWRRASSMLLWVFACGRSATPRSRMTAAIPAIRASTRSRSTTITGVSSVAIVASSRNAWVIPSTSARGPPVGRTTASASAPAIGREAVHGKIPPVRDAARRQSPRRSSCVRRHEGSPPPMTISRPAGLMQESIAEVDPELWDAMLGERHRQHDKIELIASENYTSAAVMEAQGSWLTNKYAEGLPGKRYYGGC